MTLTVAPGLIFLGGMLAGACVLALTVFLFAIVGTNRGGNNDN